LSVSGRSIIGGDPTVSGSGPLPSFDQVLPPYLAASSHVVRPGTSPGENGGAPLQFVLMVAGIDTVETATASHPPQFVVVVPAVYREAIEVAFHPPQLVVIVATTSALSRVRG
jgi:hypothetical protein